MDNSNIVWNEKNKVTLTLTFAQVKQLQIMLEDWSDNCEYDALTPSARDMVNTFDTMTQTIRRFESNPV